MKAPSSVPGKYSRRRKISSVALTALAWLSFDELSFSNLPNQGEINVLQNRDKEECEWKISSQGRGRASALQNPRLQPGPACSEAQFLTFNSKAKIQEVLQADERK